MGSVEHWEAEAARWAAWARTPGHDTYKGTFERDGLRITFKGWCHPLTAYSQALEADGFLVEAIREPEPSSTVPTRMDRYRRIPNFLMLRALKAGSPTGPRRRSSASRAGSPRSRRTG